LLGPSPHPFANLVTSSVFLQKVTQRAVLKQCDKKKFIMKDAFSQTQKCANTLRPLILLAVHMNE